MRIIAYRITLNGNKSLTIDESTGEGFQSADPDDLLAFLLEPCDNTIKVCWDLDATVAPILRLLGKENCRKLYDTRSLRIPPFSFFYYPGKVFGVRHIPTKVAIFLYGIDQYYPDASEPAQVKEVQWLGEYLMETLHKMGFDPEKLTSPVAIYESCAMRNFAVPTVKHMPKEAALYAKHCSGRLWIEAYQVGYWPECYDYDLTSAFPNAAKDLLDFRYGDWLQTTTPPSNAAYGYFFCNITIDSDVSPIIYVNAKGESLTPCGNWQGYLTMREINFIQEWGIGKVEALNGWCWIPRKTVKPLEKPLEKLLSFRGRNKLQDMLAKRMSVGLYGKLGEERKEELGPYCNFCWFAEISSQVRLKVAELIYTKKLKDNLIHVSVDGVLSDRSVTVPKGWKGRDTSALVFSSGQLFEGNKRPHGLNLTEILEMMTQKPREGYYQKLIDQRVTLGNALERDKFKDLGKVLPSFTSLDFYKVSHDRDFDKLPMTGKQLLDKRYKSKARRV